MAYIQTVSSLHCVEESGEEIKAKIRSAKRQKFPYIDTTIIYDDKGNTKNRSFIIRNIIYID